MDTYNEIIKYQKLDNLTIDGVVKVMPGVTFVINHIYGDIQGDCSTLSSNVLEINHCYSGRYECEILTNQVCYMSENDFAIAPAKNLLKSYSFPLGYYEGISIIVDRSIFKKPITLPNGLVVNPERLWAKLCPYKHVFMLKDDSFIYNLFSPLYTLENSMREKMYILVWYELLTYLELTNVFEKSVFPIYLPSYQVNKIKSIESYLTNNMDRKITIDELSKQFDISPTQLKVQFKDVFGKPVNQYMKEYRMNNAAKFLQKSDFKISEIASLVGYSSASKFSSTFHSTYNLTPKDYRRIKN